MDIPDLILKLYVFDICFSYELLPLRESNFIIIFLKAIYIYLNRIQIKG
jgi:hypothetical protein